MFWVGRVLKDHLDATPSTCSEVPFHYSRLFVIIGGRLLTGRGFPVSQSSLSERSALLKTRNSRTCHVPWFQQLPILGLLQDLLPSGCILTMELEHETAAAWCAAHHRPLGACEGALTHPSALFQLLLVFRVLPETAEERTGLVLAGSFIYFLGSKAWKGAQAVTVPVFWEASGLMSVGTNGCPLRQARYSQHYTCRQSHQLTSAHDAWGQKCHMHSSPILE